MAREDIIPQLLRQLMLKEGPPEDDNNTILQKMIIPVDRSTLTDTLTTLSVPTVSRKWGSFSWSMSQWGSIQEKIFGPLDSSTITDSMLMTKITGGSSPWGYFSWGNNTWGSGSTTSSGNTWNYYQSTTWTTLQNNTWGSL